MPVVPESSRPKRSILKLSLGVTLAAVATMLAVVFLIGAPRADAAICTLTGGPILAPGWSNAANWSTCAGGYPGQTVGGDTASTSQSITVDVSVPNGVILQMNGFGSTVDIPAASRLQIEASSTLGSGGNILQVSGGTLNINSTGPITFGPGSTIQVNSGVATNAGATALAVGGNLNIAGGSFTNSGTITIAPSGTLNVSGGTLTNNTANGVVIQGFASAGTPGTFNWSGGTLNGSGSTTINTAVTPGVLNITNSAGATSLDTQTINNSGNLTYSAPLANTLSLTNGAIINNTGSFTLSTDASINVGTSGTINNNSGGTLQKTSGPSGSVINVTVNNAGTISLPSTALTLTLSGGGSHSGATWNLGVGGTINFAGTHVFNNAETFSGFGTLNINPGGAWSINTTPATLGFPLGVNLINNGSIDFNTTIHSLSVNPNFTQTATGVLKPKLGPGNGISDQVGVASTATLGGTLTPTLGTGYTPADGDSFTVVAYLASTGSFTYTPIPYLTGAFLISYPPGAVVLTATPQADISIANVGPPTVPDGQNATFTLTIGNVGPSPTSTVSVTDTFTGGTFVSATPSNGTCSGIGPITCTMSVPAGPPQTITVVLTGSPAGTLSNSASVGLFSPTVDTNLANNGPVTATATVLPSSDLSVSPIVASANPVNAGQSETWQVIINNLGPDPASAISAGVSIVTGTITGASGPGFTCTNTATTVSCVNGSIAALSSATITVNSTAPNLGGVWTMNASVTVAADPVPGNNSNSGSVVVNPVSDIAVLKLLLGALVAGQNATYSIDLTNNGPSDATNIVIDDPTPAGLTLTSLSGSGCAAFPCTIGSLVAVSSTTLTATYSVPSSATGSVSNTATSTLATDTTPGNNSSTAINAVTTKADLSVTKTGPASANPGANVTYTITVTNNGPSDAANVSLADPAPSRLTFVSATGACTSFPCTIGTMTAGQVKTTQATYTVTAGPTAAITNTATATSTTFDPNAANNAGSASTTTACPSAAPGTPSPAAGATNVPTTGVLSWSNVNAGSYIVYLDVAGPNACTKFFVNTISTSIPYAGLQQGTMYQWRVEAVGPGCQTFSTACMSFTTASTCPFTPPTLISPLNTTVIGPATFSWSAVTGAVDYQLFVNGVLIATTSATTFGPLSVGNGALSWYVVAEFAAPCGPLQSQGGSFNGCDNSVAPLASVVGQAASGQGYDISWNIIGGATRHEIDESTSPDFTPATTRTANAPPAHFVHNVNSATAFYYRVRSFIPCANGFSANSLTVRVVLTPLSVVSNNPNVSVPAGNTDLVEIIVHVPGFPDGTFPFTATLDKPWLVRVDPSSGLLPPEGIDLTVFANPSTLPNGTFTGTVILSVNIPSSGSIVANGFTPVLAPVSISLVTAVTPKPGGTPPPNALIFPSVGHLDGINSRWQSDIRVANVSTDKAHYQLTFTPDDIKKGVKQTIIDVDPGVTTALDDIIKTWYGVGALGESANGVIEIRPAGSSGKGLNPVDAVSVSLATVASSRTYNLATNGTLGQFIPAVSFSSFIGKAIDASHAATVLGLQQIAQSSAYRTNVGVVEASGAPVSVMISAFDNAGNKLLDFPLDLQANQQVQLNSFLAQNKITNLADGRLEVSVVRGDGKITAYASVVDNRSGDPLLVSGVPLGQLVSDHYVLPGVADLNTGLAAWRTDMRIFNPTASAQFATLTFYPQNNGGSPQTSSLTINAGETKRLDSVLATLFGAAATNIGGALHVTTGNPASLVVTARTYNQTSNGTFGQFIPAVTAADAVGKGDRALQILQAEDSVRYRTNLGIAEVTGKAATVEVSVFLPDSKVSPRTQIPISANGFVQVPVIQSLGLTNVYNARISVRVVDGDGKIAAYGSVIDQKTQDPTYVPAQ